MPTISMFYGILIRMFFYDTDKHHTPHIHAEYQGQVAVYTIEDGKVLSGSLPPKKHKLVVAWIEIHQEDLQDPAVIAHILKHLKQKEALQAGLQPHELPLERAPPQAGLFDPSRSRLFD